MAWDGNAPDVQVKVIRGKDVVATVPAKLQQGTGGVDAIVTSASADGKQLKQVDFAGGRQSLVFGEAMSTQNTSGGQHNIAN